MTLGSPFAVRRARIEIIPLIDVMFFLLAAFMMVSLSLQRLRTLRAELPTAVAGSAPARMLVLEVAADGSVSADGERLSLADIQGRVRERLRADAEHPVYLRADAATLHERVMVVLDLVRAAGARRVAFALDSGPAIP